MKTEQNRDALKALIDTLNAEQDDIAACCFVLVELFIPRFVDSFDNFKGQQSTLLQRVDDPNLKVLLQSEIPKDQEKRIRLACNIIVECENVKEKHDEAHLVHECKFKFPHGEVANIMDENDKMLHHLQETIKILMEMPKTPRVNSFILSADFTRKLLLMRTKCRELTQIMNDRRRDKEESEKRLKSVLTEHETTVKPQRKKVIENLLPKIKEMLAKEIKLFFDALYEATLSYVGYQRCRTVYYINSIASMSTTLNHRLLLDAFLLWAAYYDAGSSTSALQGQFFKNFGFVLKTEPTVSGIDAVLNAAKDDVAESERLPDRPPEILCLSAFVTSMMSPDLREKVPVLQGMLLRSALLCKNEDASGNDLVVEVPPRGNIVSPVHSYENFLYQGGWDEKTNTPLGHGTLKQKNGEREYEGEFNENGMCKLTLVKGAPKTSEVTYKGPFKDGTLTGENGVMTIKEGSTTTEFIGEFKNGQLVNGKIEYKDDKMPSTGTNNLRQEGIFEGGKLVKGKKYDATGGVMAVLERTNFKNGNCYEGEWNEKRRAQKGGVSFRY